MHATNSALTLGMHHSFFCHGLSSFFQYLPDRLPGDRIGKLQLHHLVGKQSQGPAGVPFRGLAASHSHQMGFLLPIKLARLSRPRTLVEGTLHPFFGKTPPDTVDCCRTYQQGVRNLLVGKTFIGFTQNQRPFHLTG